MPGAEADFAVSSVASDVFPFLNLPVEIRHMIYKFLLTNSSPIRIQLNTDATVPRKILDSSCNKPKNPSLPWAIVGTPVGPDEDRSKCPVILRVNRQIYNEAVAVLYGANRLILHWTISGAYFRSVVGTRNVALIKHFIMIFEGFDPDWNSLEDILAEGKSLRVLRISCGFCYPIRYDTTYAYSRTIATLSRLNSSSLLQTRSLKLQSPHPVGVSVWRDANPVNQQSVRLHMLKIALVLDESNIQSTMREKVVMSNASDLNTFRNTISRVGGRTFTVDEGLDYLLQWFKQHPNVTSGLKKNPVRYRKAMAFLSNNGVQV